ncbi:MAG: SDR family NAD(P)-dependent oxidoreductase [Actinomycetota bacterium]
MDLGLSGRAAIVTGASRGIGRAIALALATEGCHVAVCGRDEAALDGVVAGIEAMGAQAIGVAAELSNDSAAELIAGRCLDAFGRLDVLVNNAGGAAPKPLDQLTAVDWQEGIDLNFMTAARMSVACLPAMRAAGWGRIVHVASVSGREPDPLFAPYSAAKAALLNLSTSLSRAYAAEGVLSSCVVPGVTITELVEANAAATAERTGSSAEDVMARLLAKQGVAAGRFGTPEEIAAAVVFLASEQAAWITGATLEVDGGTLRST